MEHCGRMETFFVLLLGTLCWLGSTHAQTIDISEIVDSKLELANRLSLLNNRSYVEYGDGLISLVSYEGAVGIGLDSIKRVGNCSMTFSGNSIRYSYSIGQALQATFFRVVKYKDVQGSGYYIARNNSLQYAYTVSYFRSRCRVRLETLQVELDDVEAYVRDKSWTTSDSSEFSDFVVNTLVPAFNNNLQNKYADIESKLETVFCAAPGQEQPTKGLDILIQFLFE